MRLHLLITLVRSSEYFRFIESLRTCIMTSQNISLNSIQSTEFDELKIFKKNFRKPVQNWENSRGVLSAPEISLDAPIRIESESK